MVNAEILVEVVRLPGVEVADDIEVASTLHAGVGVGSQVTRTPGVEVSVLGVGVKIISESG